VTCTYLGNRTNHVLGIEFHLKKKLLPN